MFFLILNGINTTFAWLLFLISFIAYAFYIIVNFDEDKSGEVLFSFLERIKDNIEDDEEDLHLLRLFEILSYIILGIIAFSAIYLGFSNFKYGLHFSNANRYLTALSLVLVIVPCFVIQLSNYIKFGKENAQIMGKIILLSPITILFISFISFWLFKIILTKLFLIISFLIITFIVYNFKFRPEGKTTQFFKQLFHQLFDRIIIQFMPTKKAKEYISEYLKEQGFQDKSSLEALLRRKNIRLDAQQFNEVMGNLENEGLVVAVNNGKAWRWVAD